MIFKAAFTYSDFAAKSQQLCSKTTTNKIARCEHHGKICRKKHSLAKSLQNRSKMNKCKHVCYMCKILSRRFCSKVAICDRCLIEFY